MNAKRPPLKITIGAKQSDEELIKKICQYQQEKGLRYASDAVRKLCEDALTLKKVLG